MDWGAWWDRWGDVIYGGIIGLIIAMVFGYYFWRKSEKPKQLGWRLLSNTPIMALPSNQLSSIQIEVTYQRVKVDNPNLVLIRIVNVGKRAVLREMT